MVVILLRFLYWRKEDNVLRKVMQKTIGLAGQAVLVGAVNLV